MPNQLFERIFQKIFFHVIQYPRNSPQKNFHRKIPKKNHIKYAPLGGLWGKKSRDTKFFSIVAFLTLTGPGQNRWSKTSRDHRTVFAPFAVRKIWTVRTKLGRSCGWKQTILILTSGKRSFYNDYYKWTQTIPTNVFWLDRIRSWAKADDPNQIFWDESRRSFFSSLCLKTDGPNLW